MMGDKIDALVEFPIEGLDLSDVVIGNKYVDGEDGMNEGKPKESLIYDLYAVSNHYGGLGGGHYTAYAKNSVDGNWYYFDDSSVTLSDPSKVMTSAAYLLFYQRRRSPSSSSTSSSLATSSSSSSSLSSSAAVQSTINFADFIKQMRANLSVQSQTSLSSSMTLPKTSTIPSSSLSSSTTTTMTPFTGPGYRLGDYKSSNVYTSSLNSSLNASTHTLNENENENENEENGINDGIDMMEGYEKDKSIIGRHQTSHTSIQPRTTSPFFIRRNSDEQNDLNNVVDLNHDDDDDDDYVLRPLTPPGNVSPRSDSPLNEDDDLYSSNNPNSIHLTSYSIKSDPMAIPPLSRYGVNYSSSSSSSSSSLTLMKDEKEKDTSNQYGKGKGNINEKRNDYKIHSHHVGFDFGSGKEERGGGGMNQYDNNERKTYDDDSYIMDNSWGGTMENEGEEERNGNDVSWKFSDEEYDERS